MATIESLPAHILERSLRYLHYAQAAADARLTCKAFAEAGALYLFDTITIPFAAYNFIRVGQYPNVLGHVRTLRLILNGSTILEDAPPPGEQGSQRRAKILDALDRHIGSALNGWRDHALVEELADYLEPDHSGAYDRSEEVSQAAFSRMLAQSPRLTALDLTMWPNYCGIEPPSTEGPASVRPKPGSPVYEFSMRDQGVALHRFRFLCRALKRCERQLVSLELHGPPDDVLAPTSKEDLVAAQVVFRNLTRLICDFPAVPREADKDHLMRVAERWRLGTPRAVLSSAQNLRVLRLSLPRDDEPCLGPDDLVGKSTWPQLQEFGLRYARVQAEEFMGFLHHHASTLQALRLTHIMLSSGTWAELMPTFCFMFPKLQHVVLRGKFCHVDVKKWHVVELSLQDDDREPCPAGTEELTQYVEAQVLNGDKLPTRAGDDEDSDDPEYPFWPTTYARVQENRDGFDVLV